MLTVSELQKGKTSGITLKDKIGYALGDTGGCLTFGIVGSFLQMFYTNVLHLPYGKIMVLFTVARLWDAINDPMWGAVVDIRKPGKKGKFLQYIRWGSIPLAVSAVLTFTKFSGLTENQYLAIAYITYIMYGMMYTVVTIPYGSLASVVTSDKYERSSLSVFRSIGAGLGGLPGQVILPLFVYTKNEMGKKELDGTKLLIGVIVLSILSVFVYQACYAMTTERIVSPHIPQKRDWKKTFRVLISNRPFIALCLSSMLLLMTQQYTQTLYNYLFLDYFKKPALFAVCTVVTYLPMLILFPFMTKLVKKYGKKELCALGMFAAAAANALLFLIKTHSVVVFFVLTFISGFGMMFFILEVWAMATDVINYQEKRSGQREEGMTYAAFSFGRKIGQTLSAVLGTGVIGLIGYDSLNLTQNAIDGLYTVSTAVPAASCLLMSVLLGFVYNLGKKNLSSIYSG